jgi:hypothetical protein
MREIFESSFSLIIVAIVVAVRFVFYLRKRTAARDKRASQAGSPSGPKPLESIKAIEAEGAGDDEEFSAWNLAVTEEETVPPPQTSYQSVFASEDAPSSAAAYAPPLPVWETIPQAVLPTYGSAPTPDPEPEPLNREGEAARQPDPVSADKARPAATEGIPARTGSPFWARFRSLPPMQQGVLMAEILGAPKGF